MSEHPDRVEIIATVTREADSDQSSCSLVCRPMVALAEIAELLHSIAREIEAGTWDGIKIRSGSNDDQTR